MRNRSINNYESLPQMDILKFIQALNTQHTFYIILNHISSALTMTEIKRNLKFKEKSRDTILFSPQSCKLTHCFTRDIHSTLIN